MNRTSKKIEWSEPWRREDVKARMRKMTHELPSWKRMLVYCIGLPCAVFGGAAFFIPLEMLDENLQWGFWGQIVLGVVVCSFVFWILPIVHEAIPRTVVIREKVISICQGTGARVIKFDNVESIAFTGDGDNRKMRVEVRGKNGGDSSVSVRLSPKVVEAEIVEFLVEKGRAHLYRARGLKEEVGLS